MLGSSVRVCLNKTYWLLFEISWKSKTKSLLMSMMLLLKNYRCYKKCIFLNTTFIIIFLKVLYKKIIFLYLRHLILCLQCMISL